VPVRHLLWRTLRAGLLIDRPALESRRDPPARRAAAHQDSGWASRQPARPFGPRPDQSGATTPAQQPRPECLLRREAPAL